MNRGEIDKKDIGEIDSIMMYKMIRSLLEYDYYSTKCLVNIFVENRKIIEEVKVLEKIRLELYDYNLDKVRKILNNKINIEKNVKKKKKFKMNI